MAHAKPTVAWGILRIALPAVLALTASVEWGGPGLGKLAVGLLVFVVSYGLLRSWSRAEG